MESSEYFKTALRIVIDGISELESYSVDHEDIYLEEIEHLKELALELSEKTESYE